jgi:hypothetical protein
MLIIAYIEIYVFRGKPFQAHSLEQSYHTTQPFVIYLYIYIYVCVCVCECVCVCLCVWCFFEADSAYSLFASFEILICNRLRIPYIRSPLYIIITANEVNYRIRGRSREIIAVLRMRKETYY